ncbi:MAG TPA: hypothetical protein P5235_09445 [Saprospiraceae bacterium]|nr:hypothetical protein [Saprospiraceae bacterium]
MSHLNTCIALFSPVFQLDVSDGDVCVPLSCETRLIRLDNEDILVD